MRRHPGHSASARRASRSLIRASPRSLDPTIQASATQSATNARGPRSLNRPPVARSRRAFRISRESDCSDHRLGTKTHGLLGIHTRRRSWRALIALLAPRATLQRPRNRQSPISHLLSRSMDLNPSHAEVARVFASLCGVVHLRVLVQVVDPFATSCHSSARSLSVLSDVARSTQSTASHCAITCDAASTMAHPIELCTARHLTGPSLELSHDSAMHSVRRADLRPKPLIAARSLPTISESFSSTDHVHRTNRRRCHRALAYDLNPYSFMTSRPFAATRDRSFSCRRSSSTVHASSRVADHGPATAARHPPPPDQRRTTRIPVTS